MAVNVYYGDYGSYSCPVYHDGIHWYTVDTLEKIKTPLKHKCVKGKLTKRFMTQPVLATTRDGEHIILYSPPGASKVFFHDGSLASVDGEIIRTVDMVIPDDNGKPTPYPPSDKSAISILVTMTQEGKGYYKDRFEDKVEELSKTVDNLCAALYKMSQNPPTELVYKGALWPVVPYSKYLELVKDGSILFSDFVPGLQPYAGSNRALRRTITYGDNNGQIYHSFVNLDGTTGGLPNE